MNQPHQTAGALRHPIIVAPNAYQTAPDTQNFCVRSLGMHPRIYIIQGFMSPEECDHLVTVSRHKIELSTVVDQQSGEMVTHPGRTSSGAFFGLGEHPLVERIEARIAGMLGIPVENGEGLQILNYQVGQFYKPHFDFFDPAHSGSQAHLERGGQRVATLLMYLNDVESAGETMFPVLGIKVCPTKGSALLFYNCKPDGMIDTDTLHSSEPVLAGEKWIATKWLREAPYC